MIYDCFSFFNELDLLEIRLNTLDKVVDKFILAESTLTHTGNPKPLYYAENKNRFAKFNDRIIHIVVDDFPTIPDASPREMAWIRENWQRNAVMRGIPEDAKENDYIIISDLDEIPQPKAIAKAVSFDGVSHLYLSMFYYFVNYKNFSNPIWCGGPQVLPLHFLHKNRTPPSTDLSFPIDWRANVGMTPSVIRFLKPRHVIKHAGWHFSYLGGIQSVIAKIQSIAHTENNTAENQSPAHISKLIQRGKLACNNHDRAFAISLDKTFPDYIIKNQKRLAHLIFPMTASYRIRSFLPRLLTTLQRIAVIAIRPILPKKFKDWLYHTFLNN